MIRTKHPHLPTMQTNQQARMWRALAQQCRERGDMRLAAEAEALALSYERRSENEEMGASDRAA